MVYFSGVAGVLRTQLPVASLMAYATGILSAMASQIGFGGAMESRVSRPYSETVANHVWTDVS